MTDTPTTEWTHDALADDLAGHVGYSNRLTYTDMQLGPSGSPRPDVYCLPTTYSRFCPVAYECKVSVADFRADVTHGKWQTYLPFASAVIFATPAGLIGKQDIPAGCGLMARGPNGWRTVKAPTLRPVENLPLQLWQKLLFDGIERAERFRRCEPRKADDWRMRDRLAKELGADVAAVFTNREAIAKAAGEIATALGMDTDGAAFDRSNVWRVRDLAYYAKQTAVVWQKIASLLGMESRWPGFRDIREAEARLSRLDASMAAERALEALDHIQRSIDSARTKLTGDQPEKTGALS